MMRFAKQYSKILSVSYMLNLSQISTRGLLLALSLVCESNTHLSYLKLIVKSVYLDSE